MSIFKKIKDGAAKVKQSGDGSKQSLLEIIAQALAPNSGTAEIPAKIRSEAIGALIISIVLFVVLLIFGIISKIYVLPIGALLGILIGSVYYFIDRIMPFFYGSIENIIGTVAAPPNTRSGFMGRISRDMLYVISGNRYFKVILPAKGQEYEEGSIVSVYYRAESQQELSENSFKVTAMFVDLLMERAEETEDAES